MNCEESILTKYVSDEKNDGTYTLRLNEKETRELWDKVDAQTEALRTLISFALEYYYPDCAMPAFKAAIEAAQKVLSHP